MVAVIHNSNSLRNALNYNEQKLKQGQAKCLGAVNYPKDAGDLNFYQKLCRLTRLAELNPGTKVNSVHISLNFGPSEKLPEATLQKIAEAYMEGIGFGRQPYLVYQHFDAAHPHLHIVTTNIQSNGKRISLHNLGKDQSEKTRKAIEKEFKLVVAGAKQVKEAYRLQPVFAQKIQYGKSETKRAITSVLDAVLPHYNYCSLAELNAVLQLYHVLADRCKEGSRTHQKNGLVYRVLDEAGNKVGVPIKASLIYNKPTLKFLEEKFEQNKTLRQPHKQRLRTVIGWRLHQAPVPLTDLLRSLEKDGIQALLRKNKEGFIYGITYIDHRSKSVFNGSDLGKEYAAKAVMERCMLNSPEAMMLRQPWIKAGNAVPVDEKATGQAIEGAHPSPQGNILEAITEPTGGYDYIPYQLKRKPRKKKGKGFSI